MILAIHLSSLCLCGEAPERANDFFWENDRVGFRAYGPGDTHKWSGIDVFNKSVSTNIVVHWLRHHSSPNFHLNQGQGMDNYAVGPGRGVGGVALRKDGKWLPDYGNWVAYRVKTNSDERCEFELDYKLPIGGIMTLAISMFRGNSYFLERVSFSKDTPLEGVEVGVGMDCNAERLHVGSLVVDKGLCVVSLFEEPHTLKDNKRTTAREGGKPIKGEEGSTMSAVFPVYSPEGEPWPELSVADEPNGAKMLMTRPLKAEAANGKPVVLVACWADWTEAGRYRTADAWHAAVLGKCKAFLSLLKMECKVEDK